MRLWYIYVACERGMCMGHLWAMGTSGRRLWARIARLGETKVSHVRSAEGSIYCEEAQSRQPQPMKRVVDVCDILVRLLRRSVQRRL